MTRQKLGRQRGVILTSTGWQKLEAAICMAAMQEILSDRYTFKELSERTELNRRTITKILDRQAAVDKRSLEQFFRAFSLELDRLDYALPDSNSPLPEASSATSSIAYAHQDFREAVDVDLFYGRTAELAKLEQWLVGDRGRLVALLGMGGIGKTALSVRSAEQLQDRFEYVIWKSLLHAPPVRDVLASLIQFLSNRHDDLPNTVDDRMAKLLEYLQAHCCLLVLDNAEAILQGGGPAGHYLMGYEEYGRLLKLVGEARHQSAVVLTSREKPKEIALLEGESLPVRSLQVGGLRQTEGQEILRTKGLSISELEANLLVDLYAGNPLALKIVATTIRNVLDGQTSEFLRQGAAVFGDIRALLKEQFHRLSDLEREIMYWLAVNREPASLAELQADIVSPVPQVRLLEALESLLRRSLVEIGREVAGNVPTFALQPVVMEYLTDCSIEQVCQEIVTEKFALFRSHALLKATAKDYIRDTQARLILQPLIDALFTVFKSRSKIEDRLTQILKKLQASPLEPGYTGGNIINLLCQLNTDLNGYDLSHLTIWQAALHVNLHRVNLAHGDLTKSVFTKAFSSILSVAFSPDGILATGDADGEISLWQVTEGKQLSTCKGHSGWVRSVAFSPDGRMLVSGSLDQTVKLWDVSTGQCLQLQGHSDRVRAVAFSPNGYMFASASDDRSVKLWDVSTGQCLHLQGHSDRVRAVAFSPDGYRLVSGSDDRAVRLWDVGTGQCLKILQGHTDGVWSVAFSPDGRTLASGSEDQTVILWDDVETLQATSLRLQGHTDGVWSVAFSSDGRTLATGSHDCTVKLWDVNTSQCLQTLQGHTRWVWSVAFSPDGQLASGAADQTVRLWDASTGQVSRTLRGYSNGIWAVAFSPQGTTLASVSDDQALRLWDVSTGEVLKTLRGHSSRVWSVAFSPQGTMLVSGSDDQTVKLWDVSTGRCLRTLQEHTNDVCAVAFSPRGQILASGSYDCTVRLWDVNTGECLKALLGHTHWVCAVAFSPDGRLLASGSYDCTVRLWDTATGKCLKVLPGHHGWVLSVAFSPDGRTLASGSDDKTIRLWDIHTGECWNLEGHSDWVQSVAFSPDGHLASSSHDRTVKLWDITKDADGFEPRPYRTLQGHTGWVWSVALSPTGQLASGSQDETIKLWDMNTGECLKTLSIPKHYEGMNITRTTGLSSAQKATLKALGAVEFEESEPSFCDRSA